MRSGLTDEALWAPGTTARNNQPSAFRSILGSSGPKSAHRSTRISIRVSLFTGFVFRISFGCLRNRKSDRLLAISQRIPLFRALGVLGLLSVLSFGTLGAESAAPPDQGSRILSLTYPSRETGVDRHILVYTPPGYRTDRTYPVVYVLHGIGGTEQEWFENADPQGILDQVIGRDSDRPFLAVFANGRAMVPDTVPENPFSPAALQAFDRFEADLMGSLIPFVEARFPVVRDRDHRVLCGLSMGGGQSLNIGLGHPEAFGWVGAFSAAPNTSLPVLAPGTSWPFVWMVCGRSDQLLGVSQAADRRLTDAGVDHRFTVIPGDHDWLVWTYGLREFAAQVFKTAGSGHPPR